VRSGRTTSARDVGSQPGVQVDWRVGRHVTLTAVYAHFFAGPFLDRSGPGGDVGFAGAWVTCKF
jgi:hypothetical protein